MENPLAVANEIIRLANNAGTPPTQMKLQKLLFYAHGWYLALCHEPLVKETFQAWKYGPVLPSVYHEFKAFGTSGITREGTELVRQLNGTLSWMAPVLTFEKTEIVRQLIKKIWQVYGKYSGNQLSTMTHNPDTPWAKAREGYDENERDIPIPNKLMKIYFKKLIKY